MVKNYANFLQFVLFFIFISILPSQMYAQCAGNDRSIIICDIENSANQTISLFSLLGGTPTPGGTWSDDNRSRGLDVTTGILNGHLIRSGGTYHYTYTAPAVAGCTDNKSTVTITIGAYPGVPAPFATVCSSANSFNLFTAFNSTVMGPHSNGSWTNSSGAPVDALISVGGLQGSFDFTYTVPPVLACETVPLSIKVTVTIFKAPEAGTATDLVLCGSTELGAYTDLDLHTLLSGEDLGGEWNGVGLTSLTDHNINLQEVFDNNGPGIYNYTYTVRSFPDNRICPDQTVPIAITLEKRLDFTGAQLVVNSSICEDRIATATYSARITQGPEVIPDGEYKVSYNVTGANSGVETITANFISGVMNFPLRSAFFNQVGAYTITVNGIAETTGNQACVNIVNLSDNINIYPLPNLDGAVLTPETICQNKSSRVQISNATRLANGNYDIVYNITGDNFATGQLANIQVVGGVSSFVIPASINRNSGAVTVTITKITNTVTGCTNVANAQGNLIINPLPNAATVTIQVNDFCLNDAVPVTISGLGNLTNATLSYTLSGSNSSTLQTVVLTVANGSSNFVIPAELLVNTGSTTISASNLINNATTCDVILTNVSDNFLINPIPVAPVAGNQEFCKVDRAVIANLVPRGSQYKWYNSAISTTPLADTYVLKSEDLYVRETSSTNCTSAPTMISVLVNDTPAPVLNTDGQNFCGLANPTIADLSRVTNVASTIAWYDAENNGNLLASTSLLVHKATYYGFDLSTVTDCISDSNLEVTVSLIDCDVSQYDFFIPDGFSPNGDNINDTFRIPDIEFLYPDYTLEIFNRYGNVMFKGNVNKPNWDGRNSESAGFGDGIAPNGVYFYIINFNKDNRKAQQGRLYLNR